MVVLLERLNSRSLATVKFRDLKEFLLDTLLKRGQRSALSVSRHLSVGENKTPTPATDRLARISARATKEKLLIPSFRQVRSPLHTPVIPTLALVTTIR